MKHEEIQRLAAADLDEETFRGMVEEGEGLLVERKSELPKPEALGKLVGSLANTLGGWILLGVTDRERKIVGGAFPPSTDPQSHIGNLLRNQVDPVPPFLAGALKATGHDVGYVRVFQAATPVLATGTGAVYVRDAGGTRPISDHRDLLALATRGQQAETDARVRADAQVRFQHELLAPRLGYPGGKVHVPEGYLRVIVRGAPLTVTPQFQDWPVSKRGSSVCWQVARRLADLLGAEEGFDHEVSPRGRLVTARACPLQPPPADKVSWLAIVAADCAGVAGAAVAYKSYESMETHDLRRRAIRPGIEAVVEVLEEAEAYGDAVLDMWLCTPGKGFSLAGEARGLPRGVHCGSARLTIPAGDDECAALGRTWEREIAREAGMERWADQEDVNG
jgi:hypothetical protein